MTRILSIHYLRGIAALGVLIYHASAFVGGYGSGLIPMDMLRLGEAGVDVFFVISGFILTLVTQKSLGRLEFILGRLIRVGVPYWTVSLALAGASLALPFAFRTMQWSVSDLLLSLSFVPSIAKNGALFPILEPGWTLSLEMMFYGILALTLGLQPKLRSFVVMFVLAALALLGLMAAFPVGVAWFFTQAVLVEFCFGIAIALLFLGSWAPSRRVSLLFAGASLAGFVLASSHPPDAFSPDRLVWYGVPAGLLVAAAVLFEKKTCLRKSPAMTLFGDISYSLYLTHVLVLGMVAKVLGARIPGLAGDLLLFVAMAVAAIAVAYIFHVLVERPAFTLSARTRNLFGRSGRLRPAFAEAAGLSRFVRRRGAAAAPMGKEAET